MIDGGILQTPRLKIRPMQPGDAPELVRILGNRAVARFVGSGQPLSPEDAATWVSRSATNLKLHGYGTGVVVERKSDRVIGWAGFARPDDDHEQIVYGIEQLHWGQGLGSEIAAALVENARRRGKGEVFATIDPANAGSLRILLKLGFTLLERRRTAGDASDLYRRVIALA